MLRLAVAVVALAGCTEIGDPALLTDPLETGVPSGALSFDVHIKPILVSGGCSECHVRGGGGDGSLDVQSATTLLAGGDGGPAVVPCDHEASNLWIRTEAGDMPQGGTPLTDIQRATIAKWIDQGGQQDYVAGTCPDAPLD